MSCNRTMISVPLHKLIKHSNHLDQVSQSVDFWVKSGTRFGQTINYVHEACKIWLLCGVPCQKHETGKSNMADSAARLIGQAVIADLISWTDNLTCTAVKKICFFCVVTKEDSSCSLQSKSWTENLIISLNNIGRQCRRIPLLSYNPIKFNLKATA